MAAVLLAAAVACSSSSSSSDGGTDVPGPDPGAEVHPLVDRSFVATGVTEDGAPRELVPGTQISLTFEPGELQADAGCNSLFGDLTIEDDRFVVSTMSGTEMGCPGGRQEQDDWLVSLLTAMPTWRLDGDALTITSGTTTIELVDEEAVVSDAPLVGTDWILESIVDGETASSVPSGVSAPLAFQADGQVVGGNGCNGFGGSYTAGDGTVTFGLIGQTLIGCDAEKAAVEAHVMAVVQGEVAYAIEGDALTLTASGGDGLVYRAEPG